MAGIIDLSQSDPTNNGPTISQSETIRNVLGIDTELNAKFNVLDFTGANILTEILTVDGDGSSLDSDLLDGNEGTYYLDYNNFTNTPNLVTVALSGSYTDLTNTPTNVTEFANDANYISLQDLEDTGIFVYEQSSGSFDIDLSTRTSALPLPAGTTGERPASAGTGQIRFNNQLGQFEGYDGSNWSGLGGVVDIDQDTLIDAEQNSDEDKLRFITAGSERMIVDENGNVGIGTSSPSKKFQVNGGMVTTGIADNAVSQTVVISSSDRVGIGTSSPSQKLNVNGNILATGDITAFSDIRIKDNIQSIKNPVEKIKEIRGVTYTRKDQDNQTPHIGVIAQDVEKVFPELVTSGGDYKSVNYEKMVAVLVEVVKEQQKQIDALLNDSL